MREHLGHHFFFVFFSSFFSPLYFFYFTTHTPDHTRQKKQTQKTEYLFSGSTSMLAALGCVWWNEPTGLKLDTAHFVNNRRLKDTFK